MKMERMMLRNATRWVAQGVGSLEQLIDDFPLAGGLLPNQGLQRRRSTPSTCLVRRRRSRGAEGFDCNFSFVSGLFCKNTALMSSSLSRNKKYDTHFLHSCMAQTMQSKYHDALLHTAKIYISQNTVQKKCRFLVLIVRVSQRTAAIFDFDVLRS
jgi:hypothetical protein